MVSPSSSPVAAAAVSAAGSDRTAESSSPPPTAATNSAAGEDGSDHDVIAPALPAVPDGGDSTINNSNGSSSNNINHHQGGITVYDQPPQPQLHQQGMNASHVPYLPPPMYPYGPPPPPHMMYPYGPPPPPHLHPRMPGPSAVAVGGGYPPPPMQMHMHMMPPHHPGAATMMYGHPPHHPPPDAMPPIMYPPPPHHYPYPQMMHYPHPMQQQPQPQLIPSMMRPPSRTSTEPTVMNNSENGTDEDDVDAEGNNANAETPTTSPEKSSSPSQNDEDSPDQQGQLQQQDEEVHDNDDGGNDGNADTPKQEDSNDGKLKVEEAEASAAIEEESSATTVAQDPDTSSNSIHGPPSITKLFKVEHQDETNMTPTTCNTTLSQISPQRLDSIPNHHHHHNHDDGGSNDAPNPSNNSNNTGFQLGPSSGGMRMMLYPSGNAHPSLATATPLYRHPSNPPPPPPRTTLSSSSFAINTPQTSMHLLSSPYDYSHGSFSAITTNSHVQQQQQQQQQQYFPMPVSSSALSGGGGGNHYHQHHPYNNNNNNNNNNDDRMHPPNNRMPASTSFHQRPQQKQQHQPQYVHQYQHFDPRSHEDDVAVAVEKGNLSKKKMEKHTTTNTTNHDDTTNAHHYRQYYPSNNPGGGGGGNHVIPPTVHMPKFPGGYFNKDVSPLTTSHFSAIKNASAAAAAGGGSSTVAISRFGNHTTGFLDSPPDTSIPNFGNASPILASDVAGGDDDDDGGGGRTTSAEFQSGPSPGGDGNAPATRNYVKASPLDLLSSVSTSPVMAHHPGKRARSYNMMQQQQERQHPPHGHSTYSYPPSPQYHSYAHPQGASSYGLHYQEGQDNNYSPGSLASTATTDPTTTPMKPKQSNLELMLSAANTLDIDESSKKEMNHNHTKKRKLSPENAKTIKKRLLVNTSNLELTASSSAAASASGNLFSVGGYPPGFDLTTLPPTRPNSKSNTNSKIINNATKCIDSESVAQARQAMLLAEQALERPRVGKQLLLSMALVRTNPRTPPSCYPAHGTVLTDRFHWAAFPPLDMILRKNMKRYYELSTNKCQSRDQQEFNNELVTSVKAEAQKYGWEFDDKAFDDKKIRDRIRCFYKTHIQNAKKRLKTMLRHPEKRANIKALAAHFHLIEEKGYENEDPKNTTALTAATTDDENGDDCESVDANEGSLCFGLSQSYSTENEQLPQYYHEQQKQQKMKYQDGGDQRYGIESHYR